MALDRLQRIISVGDIIAVGNYSNTINIAKVYKITKKSVLFTCFKGNPDPKGRYSWSILPLQLSDLTNPNPTGWRGFCVFDRCPNRLLILKKN